MCRIRRSLSILTLALVAIAGPLSATAKGVESEQLFAATLNDMPPAPTPAAVARITFAPGSGLSMTANLGPALHFVEAGSFDVLMLGTGAIERAGATTPEEATPVAEGEQLTIEPGDLLVIPANTPFEVYNNGIAQAEALIIEFFSRDLTAPLPDGIVLDLLVAGQAAALTSRTGTVTLSRITVEPGAHIRTASMDAVNLIYVERGAASYSVVPPDIDTATMVGESGMPDVTAVLAQLALPADSAVVAQAGGDDMVQNIAEAPLSLLILTLTFGPAATS